MAESQHRAHGPIWTRPEPAARSLRFSRQQIAAAALEIADAEGFEAVSMRRIARSLGAGTMSLYRYIATKDDLLALIGDALLGEALVPGELPADWLEAIAAVARQTRRAYLRHPWALHLVQRQGAAKAALGGPNGLRRVEQSLSALSGAPMDARAKLDVLAIVDDYVFGHLVRAADGATEAQADDPNRRRQTPPTSSGLSWHPATTRNSRQSSARLTWPGSLTLRTRTRASSWGSAYCWTGSPPDSR